MFVTRNIAFWEVLAPVEKFSPSKKPLLSINMAKRVSEHLEFDALATLSELSKLNTNFEKRNMLRWLTDVEVVALNNTIFMEITQRRSITKSETDLLNVIYQSIQEKWVNYTIGQTIQVDHADNISRYDQVKGRPETLKWWSRVNQLSIIV